MKYQDVFVPGGFPKYTYNPREALKLEERLGEVKENLCKLVTVTGNTKSGKTVLTRKVLPTEDAIWVDGGSVSEESDFWEIVVEQLDLFQISGVSREATTTSAVGGALKSAASFLGIVKGEGEVRAELEKGRSEGESGQQILSSRVAALKGLKSSGIPLVIDDFHYLPRALQGTIVRALKPLVFDGQPVVIIAIPHRRFDAMKVEREMTGRIYPMQIPPWSTEELTDIPKRGFTLLEKPVHEGYLNVLAEQSIGSPHLMQDFCREACRQDLQLGSDAKGNEIRVLTPVFKDVAEAIGRPIFEKLARGPRQRTDRVPRTLKTGESVDIYQLVLHALAHMKPGLVSIEYEQLRAAIRDVSASAMPQLHEVARVLKHMASIAATDQSSTPVIDFEEDEKKLHITDPFFAFYLRWGSLSS